MTLNSCPAARTKERHDPWPIWRYKYWS